MDALQTPGFRVVNCDAIPGQDVRIIIAMSSSGISCSHKLTGSDIYCIYLQLSGVLMCHCAFMCLCVCVYLFFFLNLLVLQRQYAELQTSIQGVCFDAEYAEK